MHDVFVSYRHARKAEVVDFCERMKAAGLTVFRDEERREDDDSIQRTIETGLAEAKVFLAWYDPTYLQSKACSWEFSRALVAAYAGGDGLKRIVCIDPTGAFDHIVPTALKNEARLVRDGVDGIVGVLRERIDAFAHRFGTSVVRGSTPWYGLQRPSHPTWIGRASLLIELFDLSNMGGRMIDGGQRAPVALTGWGGEGKSMLAQQYALRFATAYPAGIVWISGATADGVTPREGEWLQQLETSLTGVAVALDIAIGGLVEGIPDPRQRIVRIRAAIEHGLWARIDDKKAAAPMAPYLWIVDDLPRDLGADDQRLWLAADERAHGVVTIRERRDVDAVCHVLPVRHLGEDEAIAILSRRRAPADAAERAAAQAIVEALGRLPLALEAAGAYVAQRGYARYLKLLDEPGSTEEVDRLVTSFAGALPTGHEASIVKTLLRSLDLLPGWDDARTDAPANAAWATLRIAALLAPLPLSEDFAIRALQSGGWPLRNGLMWEDVRSLLYRAGLVQEAGPSSATAIDLHALIVRLVVDVRSTPERREETVEGIVAALDRWREEKEGVDVSRVGSDLFEVALAVAPSCASVAAATVLLRIATLARRAGRLSAARVLGERTLLIRSTQFGDEHPATLTSMNNLASTMGSQGDFDGARTMQEQVLTVRRLVLGDEHPATLTSMNNLASTMRSQGDLDGGRAMQEQVLTVRGRMLGDEHPDTLTTMNNLALTMRSQGDLDGARAMQEQVLTVRRRVLGDEHPDTLTTMNNLALTMRSQGDLDGARAMQEQVLTVRRRVLGDEHPDTLTTMNNLASTMGSQGDFDGARTMQEQVLSVRRLVLGDEHPATLTSMNNLASTMGSQGDFDGARTMQEQVLSVRRLVLGDEHPATLTSMNNLASTMGSQGDFDGARTMQEQVLTVRRLVLGDEHPATLTSMNNLASTMRSQGDLDGARAMQEQVLTVRRLVLGDQHPATLTAMSNLAETIWSQGDQEGSRAMQEQVLTVRRLVLGDRHPATLTAMSNLAETIWSQGDQEGSRAMQEQILTIRRCVLGDEHPATLTSMNNLASTMWSQGDLDGARAMQEQVVTVSCRVLGDKHPDTLVSMNNLAETMRSQGDLDGARAMLEQVVTVSCRVLGNEHPDTLAARENLASTVELLESAASASLPPNRATSQPHLVHRTAASPSARHSILARLRTHAGAALRRINSAPKRRQPP